MKNIKHFICEGNSDIAKTVKCVVKSFISKLNTSNDTISFICDELQNKLGDSYKVITYADYLNNKSFMNKIKCDIYKCDIIIYNYDTTENIKYCTLKYQKYIL